MRNLLHNATEFKKELVDFEAQHTTVSNEIERVQKEIERKEQALTRLHEANAKAMTDRNDRTRVLRHAAKVRQTLSTFRNTVVEQHVRHIEQLVLESYTQLLQKASLVTGLSIDPEQFSITHSTGATVRPLHRNGCPPENVNSSQLRFSGALLRRLAALCLRRSIRRLVDSTQGHRVHLVERYLPFASHQVLLLSTDEEIVGDYLDRLKPWIRP